MTSIAHALTIGLGCICVANAIVRQSPWWSLAGLICFLRLPLGDAP